MAACMADIVIACPTMHHFSLLASHTDTLTQIALEAVVWVWWGKCCSQNEVMANKTFELLLIFNKYLFLFELRGFGDFSQHSVGHLDHLSHLILVVAHKLKHDIV